MRVLLSGGGTAGSVAPLLSIYEKLKIEKPETEFLFIGTRHGEPENRLLEKYQLFRRSIFSGKLRRYFDWRNITDIFLVFAGFFQALIIIGRFKPDVVISAGAFVSVPVNWAAWVLRKKILIHQQDLRPSLSNILCVNLANRITVAFERSLQNFPAYKTVWTGNPVRPQITDGSEIKAYERFKLNKNLPLLLIFGGGTGALGLNTIINQALPELTDFCQIIHLTGAGKRVTGIDNGRYQQFEFIFEEMPDLLTAADLVIARAGMSSLTELSALGKPSILIPLPYSHQRDNADYYAEKSAAKVYEQENLSPGRLTKIVRELLNDPAALDLLSQNIRKMMKPLATELIIKEIMSILK